MTTTDIEIVSTGGDLVARRIVVGALETNCWILFHPADRQAIVVDPGDEPQRIIDACRDLIPTKVVLTHHHWDHVLALPDISDHYGIDVISHPGEDSVWPHETAYLEQHGHFDAGTATTNLLRCGCLTGAPPDRTLWNGTTSPVQHLDTITAGRLQLQVRHTPGHTPGSISLVTHQHVFTGDTLFPGGPGLTGWPLSDFATIIDSIRTRLFTLAGTVAVHPGHGRSTTIAAEKPLLPDWVERGW